MRNSQDKFSCGYKPGKYHFYNRKLQTTSMGTVLLFGMCTMNLTDHLKYGTL